MNPPKILNISAEDLALAKKRQISIATLSDKYGVHRKTMIKNLNHDGIERYVLRGKKPEDRKTIALDPKDVDALTAKLTSFFKLCQKYKASDPVMRRSLKKLGIEWQRVGGRKRLKLSAKDKRDFLASKTTVMALSVKYDASLDVIRRHLSELGKEPKPVTSAWLKPRREVAQLRKTHTLKEIAALMGKTKQRIFMMMSTYETWMASVDSYERLKT